MTTDPEATHPEPAPQPPIETRIQGLLDAWSMNFNLGNIDGLMRLLADEPRENRNRGRRWFRRNYGEAMSESSSRRLDIRVAEVRKRRDGWAVVGDFDLTLTYPENDPVAISQQVTYRVVESDTGELRIRAIEY